MSTNPTTEACFKHGDKIEVEWVGGAPISRRLIRASGEIIQLPLTAEGSAQWWATSPEN